MLETSPRGALYSDSGRCFSCVLVEELGAPGTAGFPLPGEGDFVL